MSAGAHGRFDHLPRIAANEALLARWQSAAANWVAALPAQDVTQRLLLDAFELYLDRCDGGARLIVLAHAVPDAASNAFQSRVAQRGCAAHIECFVDPDDADTKSALLSADALLLADAHEDLVRGAAALGTPVVTGFTEGFATEAGLAWDSPDASVLAASVECLRADAGLRAHLRERAFAWIARNGLLSVRTA
jgi:hypothetical protein